MQEQTGHLCSFKTYTFAGHIFTFVCIFVPICMYRYSYVCVFKCLYGIKNPLIPNIGYKLDVCVTYVRHLDIPNCFLQKSIMKVLYDVRQYITINKSNLFNSDVGQNKTIYLSLFCISDTVKR